MPIPPELDPEVRAWLELLEDLERLELRGLIHIHHMIDPSRETRITITGRGRRAGRSRPMLPIDSSGGVP